MTYRLLLWFDMLEEEGKSTERVRGLFANRMPLLSKDLSSGDAIDYSSNRGSGDCNGSGYGYGDGHNDQGDGHGSGYNYNDGDGFGLGWVKIMAVKI